MSTIIKLDRLEELKIAIQHRTFEIEQLQRRKDELLASRTSEDADTAPPSIPQKSSAFSSSELSTLVQEYPILFHVSMKPAVEVDKIDIPPEQVGNYVTQLTVAIAAVRQKTKLISKAADTAALQHQRLEDQQKDLGERIDMFIDLTGIPSKLHENENPHMSKSKSRTTTGRRIPRLSKTLCADSAIPAAAFTDEVRPSTQSVNTTRQQCLKVSKEVHLAEVLYRKQEKTILSLQKTIEAQNRTREENMEMKNKIRCLKRDIEEKKVTLERLLTQHAMLDKQLTIALGPSSTTRRILDHDVSQLRRQVEDCVEGERRVQERIIKAQEFRIQQLEKRLASVKRGVQNHKLEKQIESILLGMLTTTSHSNNEVEMERSPNSNRAASAPRSEGDAEDKQRETSPKSPSPDGRGHSQAGSASASPTSPRREWEVPATKEALYDMDSIVPPKETIHRAIYSLFASERDQLVEQVAAQRREIQTKDQELDRLAETVAQLVVQLDEAQALREATECDLELQEDGHREEGVAQVMEQRTAYAQLLQEKIKLQKEAHLWWQENSSSFLHGNSSKGRRASAPSSVQTSKRPSRAASSTASSQKGDVSPRESSPVAVAAEPAAKETTSAPTTVEDDASAVSKRRSTSRVRFADQAVEDSHTVSPTSHQDIEIPAVA